MPTDNESRNSSTLDIKTLLAKEDSEFVSLLEHCRGELPG